MVRKSTSKPVKTHLPCEDCGSSDALALYDDGHTYCFSCTKLKNKVDVPALTERQPHLYNYTITNTNYPLADVNYPLTTIINSNNSSSSLSKFLSNKLEDSIAIAKTTTEGSWMSDNNNSNHDEVPSLSQLNNEGRRATEGSEATVDNRFKPTKQLIDYRGLTRETYKAYGCYFVSDGFSEEPKVLVFPYEGGKANKVRKLAQKSFSSEGLMNEVSLFGMDLFNAGSAQAITITEGELDALSVYQMMGSKYPAVSVRSSSSALADCTKSFKYLNSFERIYLCFDNDEPGLKATKEVARLFDPNKVFVVPLTKFKDANEYLVNGAANEFTKSWWNSKKYMPKGIITGLEAFKGILEAEVNQTVASYPFPTLDEMLYGIRYGEVVLFKAQEKVGKSSVFRRIEHHLLKTTKERIGIIHLEDTDRESLEGLITNELKVPAHLPNNGLDANAKLKALATLDPKGDRIHIYSHFGSEDPTLILDMVRYLVAVCGCKFVFLDHLTMLVTGFQGEDERKTLDYISTRLKMLAIELNFTLFLISHVNDDGKTRGSRNISKVANAIISLERDLMSPDPEVRNVIKTMIEGNRFAGLSGPSGDLVFDLKSYTLSEKRSNEQETEHFNGSPNMETTPPVVPFKV